MINLEVYLEQHHSNNDGTQELESTPLSGGVPGKGEYITRGGKRLHIRGYETADPNNRSGAHINSVRQVTLEFGDTKGVIDLDDYGIGRLHIPPNQWLVIQDNTVLEKQILPD